MWEHASATFPALLFCAGSVCIGSMHICNAQCWRARQMTALTLLLAASGGGSEPWVHAAGVAGPPLLCAAAALSVTSLAAYLRALWKFL